MSFKQYFIPDGMYENIYQISASLLSSMGKKGVIFDIDNTVAPYEILRPTKEMLEYFKSLNDLSITVAFVSNNKKERTNIFNEELGFFCVPEASKPSPKGILKCIDYMGLPKEKVVLVGDQIFTDCFGAHRSGIECFIVKPIKDKKTLFFKLKRFFERPFIRLFKDRKQKHEQKKLRRNELKKQRKEAIRQAKRRKVEKKEAKKLIRKQRKERNQQKRRRK